MKHTTKIFATVFVAVLFIVPTLSQAATLVNLDFNNGSWSPLTKDSWWTYQSTGGVGGSGAMRLEYSVAGDPNKYLTFNADPYDTDDYWIEFNVKATGANPTGGSKFIKFFGKNASGDTTHSHNNMTVGLEYGNMLQSRVSYYGDTLCSDTWGGPIAYPASQCLPSSTWLKKGSSINILGGSWGHYKVHVKRADSGTRNGETQVWWNGNEISHITNQNSNPTSIANSNEFYKIVFGSYNHALNFTGGTWYLWIDNLYIGTTEKSGGSTTPPITPPTTTDTTPPNVPSGVRVQ